MSSISHDVLQSKCSDVRRPHAGQREERSQPIGLFPLQDVEETSGITRRGTPKARHDFVVTAPFAHARGLSIGPPDQRVEPPEELCRKLHAARQHVPPTDVNQLVSQDQLKLIRLQVLDQETGKRTVGRITPRTAGPTGFSVTTRRIDAGHA